MKKILFYLAAALLVSTAMTSCLKDSDNNGSETGYHTLTATERSAIVQTIRQHYTGQVKFVNDSMKIDSIPSSMSFVGDTTVMLDFPVSILANYLTDSSVKADKEILAKAPNSLIECIVQVPTYVSNSYWTNCYQKGEYPGLLFYPKSQTAKFTVEEKTFELTFSYNYLIFDSDYFTPYMYYFNKQAYAFLLLTSIKASNGLLLYINKPVEFIGKVD